MRGAFWFVAAVSLVLSACSRPGELTPDDLKARWDAQNVPPQNYKGDLLAFMRTYLNDPTQVKGAQLSPPTLKKAGPGDRYVSCVRYNARNTDGKYVGSKDGAAVYTAGKLESFVDTPVAVKEICKDAAYAPFPELEKLTR